MKLTFVTAHGVLDLVYESRHVDGCVMRLLIFMWIWCSDVCVGRRWYLTIVELRDV